jgi:hypothetical protein
MKTTIVTKKWTSNVGLSRFSNKSYEASLLTNGEISNEKNFNMQDKMLFAILSKVH